jgi:hypothetical protein
MYFGEASDGHPGKDLGQFGEKPLRGSPVSLFDDESEGLRDPVAQVFRPGRENFVHLLVI